MKINVNIEEVDAYKRTRYETERDGSEFGWVAKFTDAQTDDLFDRLKEKIENRKKYRHILKEEIYRKIKAIMPKAEEFTADMVANLPDAITKMADEYEKRTKLNKVKPLNRSIPEVIADDAKDDK